LKPLVSIVIPVYNGEAFISETIASALEQSWRPIEILIVDDGSTDRSTEIVKTFGDPVRLIQKKNGGPASARNLGIKEAKGEFISFLDGDDLWKPDKLELQVQMLLENTELALVHTGRWVLKNESLTPGQEKALPKVSNSLDSLRTLFWHNEVITSSVMVRAKVLDDLGGFNESPDYISLEDYDLWIRIAKHHGLGYLKECLTIYRVHAGGISRNIDRLYRHERNVLDAWIREDPDPLKDLEYTIGRRYAKLYLDWGLDHLVERNLNDARKALLKAIRCDMTYMVTWRAFIKSLLPAHILQWKDTRFSKEEKEAD